MKSLFDKIRAKLRPEEFVALIFLLPFAWIVLVYGMTPLLHFTTVLSYFAPGVMIAAVILTTERSGHRAWRVVRDFLPFALAVCVYENMRNVTEFLHLADKHEWLIVADEWLFGGVNPVVWMERFVSKPMTDFMVAAYTTYYFYPPILTMVLYRRGQIQEFRNLILAIVLTFYIGYLGFIAVPAVDPWHTMRERFTLHLQGSPLASQALDLYTISGLKIPRDCFPSLHTAVSLVVLAFAWRTWRGFFWVALPCIIALMVSTIYLRAHYVVDLLAAFPLSLFTVWAAPRLNRWWFRPNTPTEGSTTRAKSRILSAA
jgi:membrane-associated phospholipid phosphatase